jgi:hypothetical protein
LRTFTGFASVASVVINKVRSAGKVPGYLSP